LLSKAVRCSDHDLQQLIEVHLHNAFDYELVLERSRIEMTHVIGDHRRVKANFLDLVRELFGELRLVSAEKRLRDWR